MAKDVEKRLVVLESKAECAANVHRWSACVVVKSLGKCPRRRNKFGIAHEDRRVRVWQNCTRCWHERTKELWAEDGRELKALGKLIREWQGN